jgi:hypothetical protein
MRVLGGEDGESVSFVTEPIGTNCRLTCSARGKSHVAEASDFFAGLQLVRLQFLEPQGLIPICYGASLKVWPSSMAREMGRGLKAYKIELGADASELVRIFDEGADVIPSSVQDQEQFAKDWFASARR